MPFWGFYLAQCTLGWVTSRLFFVHLMQVVGRSLDGNSAWKSLCVQPGNCNGLCYLRHDRFSVKKLRSTSTRSCRSLSQIYRGFPRPLFSSFMYIMIYRRAGSVHAFYKP